MTTPDRILRELDLIHEIFANQFSKYELAIGRVGYKVLDESKKSTDGRYLQSFRIYSEVELFNLQSYKAELTQRFEQANNTELFKNQLLKIKGKAVSVRDFYNANLSDVSEIARDFTEKHSNCRSAVEVIELCRRHQCSMIVGKNLCLNYMFYGSDNIPKSFRSIFQTQWNYLSCNSGLAEVCQHLIGFVDDFSLAKQDVAQVDNDSASRVSIEFVTYLERRGSDNEDLKKAIPELPNVIDDVCGVANEEGKELKKSATQLPERISENEAKRLRMLLVEKQYISGETNDDLFLYWFGCKKECENPRPILWVKKNSRTSSPSKKSLLDLLVLIGYDEKCIRQCINNAFSIDKGKQFKAQDYTSYRNWYDICSEYHKELEEIVNKIRNNNQI